ncbi:hypothetical protein AAC387_Pa01g2024 [Persea americana]
MSCSSYHVCTASNPELGSVFVLNQVRGRDTLQQHLPKSSLVFDSFGKTPILYALMDGLYNCGFCVAYLRSSNLRLVLQYVYRCGGFASLFSRLLCNSGNNMHFSEMAFYDFCNND